VAVQTLEQPVTATTRSLHLPAGSAAAGAYSLQVTPESAGWGHSSLRALELPAGGTHTLDTGPDEVVVVPLQGGLRIDCDGETLELTGRPGVFAGPTDFGYLPLDARATLTSDAGGRFALCGARAQRRLPVRYGRLHRPPGCRWSSAAPAGAAARCTTSPPPTCSTPTR
jgi:5-deoxy-glucuronate isomerase